ncbi:unnamed protein product [Aureobasidium pullulans]|nr:unnamed protein product [Aureobasidium pullulans]
MPYNLNCSSMDLVLSHTSSTTYPTGVLANGDTGKDPGYIVLNNGDTGKDPGARGDWKRTIQCLPLRLLR